MIPAEFDYVAPGTLDEVIGLLADRDDEARVLAGGQSLIPLMKLRFAAPALLVDLRRVPGLDAIELRHGFLQIGALACHRALARSPLAAGAFPLLPSTAGQIADPLVRNLGTLAGSLAHADPRGDWGSAMLALQAQLVIRGRAGRRRLAIDEFFRGAFETALEPGEILESVQIPIPRAASAGCYLKLERKVGDYATVAAAVQLELDAGRIQRAGIALTAVGPRNLRAHGAEALLRGAEPTQELFAEAARLAAQVCEPTADLRGSVEYKRNVVAVFVKRALAESLALARARAGEVS